MVNHFIGNNYFTAIPAHYTARSIMTTFIAMLLRMILTIAFKHTPPLLQYLF